MSLEEPPSVVAFDERSDHLPGPFEALEVVEIQALLFERAHEAFGDTVAFGFSDVGRRGSDPEPGQFALELVGRVLRAPVVT